MKDLLNLVHQRLWISFCGHSEFFCVTLHMYVTAVTVVVELFLRAHRWLFPSDHDYVIFMEEAKEKRVKTGKLV